MADSSASIASREPPGRAAEQAGRRGEVGARLRYHQRDLGTAVAADLAGDEVDGLDGVGALIDRRDADVAEELRRAGLLDEAHAAMHLHAA